MLIPKVKKAFEELKMAFTTVPVLRYFNPKLLIRIKTNTSGYTINSILS